MNSLLFFLLRLLSQNLLLHSASFSARELLIVTFFGFVCIWLLSQELTGRVLSYVGILMLVLESVLQILRHQFMLTSMLQEFKNTPQKDLNGVWKHNPVVSVCVVVCILSPTFWKDDRNRVSEATGIEQKIEPYIRG